MKIWRDNRLARFYVPVLHWRNGQYVPCFYDKVTDIYIYNLGTDTPTYKIQGDYLLDYIANGPDEVITRNVYFDSSVIPDASTKVDIKCACNYNTATQNVPILSGIDANWKGLSIFTPMNTKIQARIGNSYVVGPDASSNVEYIITTYQDGTTGYLIINGTTYTNATSSAYGTVPAYLFAYNVNGTVNTSVSYSGMKIYYTNFASGNIPSKSYIPVFHNNQAAFLDLNSGTYIYNLGTTVPYYQFKN